MSRPTNPRILSAQALLFGLITMQPVWSQMPASSGDTSASHLRAVAVYEYLGDLKKPEKSRLVPVSVWDGTQFQPGGLYLADPEPITVQSGTLYELEQDGTAKGLIDITQAAQIAIGWVGLGKFRPEPSPQQLAKLHMPSRPIDLADDDDKYTPHFAYRPPKDTGVAGTVSRDSGPKSGSPAPDPDRPVLHNRTGDSSTADADTDRPTLHRHLSSNAGPSFGNTVAPDPDRPHLSYGIPQSLEKIDKADALTGMPSDMDQMVAVSDPDSKTGHSYAWSWASPEEKEKTLAQMETLARKEVIAAAPPPPAARPVHTTPTGTHTAHAKPAPRPPELELADEDFRAFELSWGSGPVYVLTARTAGAEAGTKYVTVIAKPDFSGNLLIMLQQVTPFVFLDYRPRMQLIDAVDPTGAERADLLFELRQRNSRQFALYDVSGSQAQQVFATGPQQ